MEGLPKLPGLDFENRLKLHHSVSHSFDFVNGYRIPRPPPIGIGGQPLKEDSIAFVSQDDSVLFDPALTYGRVKKIEIAPFQPHFVIYDKIVLTFHAFFKQGIPESDKEYYRIRYVNIMYFMEDDSLTVMEPPILNSGFPQGRIIRRGKIPKNIRGDFYTWKDLNIGIDIELHGIVFHITDCDEYTKEFMAAQGVELNESECQPIDPVTSNKLINVNNLTRKTPANDDKLRRYLEYQGKVLTFDCVLDETDRPFGECMSFKMYYFLEDDTVAVRELKENREGRDHFPMLLKRTKLPKNWKQRPVTYPSCSMEISDAEVNEYYQPKDFIVGETIFIFGRRFLLLDCDRFTRNYYENILKQSQKSKLSIKFPEKHVSKRNVPTYLGLGTPEDSMASCYNLVPKPPKKDIVCYLKNANKYLRFGCVLDNAHPEDQIRQFILKMSLADGKISIAEISLKNSGIPGGKFLSSQFITRPDSNTDKPEYYTTKDLWIGSILTIHCHRFKIVSADLYVYRYMKEHPEIFSPDAIDGVRNYCLLNGNLSDDIRTAIQNECLEYQTQKKETLKPSEPLSFMDTCLQNLHVNDDNSKMAMKLHDDTVGNNRESLEDDNSGEKRKVTFAVA